MHDAVDGVDAPRRRTLEGATASRRRHLFFCVASLWGYVLGIAILAAALSRGAEQVALDRAVAVWLAIGSLVGLAGGWIVAGAYSESRRRHR